MHFFKTIIVVAALAAGLASLTTANAAPRSSEPVAAPAATKCTALIQKGKKLVPVYERVYKYKFVKVKGSKQFKRKIVRVRQKMKVPCAKQCVVTKKKKGKRRPVYVVVKKKVLLPRNGKLVSTKKRLRVYKFGKCPKKSVTTLGTPVTISVLDGSKAILDFGAFQREAPITGELKGFVPGGINLSADSQVTLTRGELRLAPTAVFIDDDCNGQVSAAIRTGDPTRVLLDKGRESTSTVFANGTVTATTYTVIRLPLELRNDDNGCDRPYLSTGYSEFKHTFFLKGKLDAKTALSKLKLVSAPDPIDVPACLGLGIPTAPCSGYEIPFPTIVSTEIYVAIKLS